MSFIPALFNSDMGAGFKAQQGNVLNPSTVGQADENYAQSQNAIAQQQQFVNALQQAGGPQNLQNVYQQLQGVANGTGPNPAQAMLAQATGNNVAATGANIASARGAGANAGLVARNAANVGANAQQQAAAQGANLQANQSLNALNQMGGLAGQQVAAQQAGLSGLNGAAQGEQGQILGSIQGQNNANVSNAGQANSANAAIAKGNQAAQSGIFSSMVKNLSGGLQMADGGVVPGHSAPVQPIPMQVVAAPVLPAPQPMVAPTGPQSFLGRMMSGLSSPQEASNPNIDPNQKAGEDAGAAIGKAMGKGIKAGGGALMDSLGLVGMAKGGMAKSMKTGGNVPGQASVPGNSYANDTVKAKLSPGEIVLPRSVTQSSDPVNNAAKFVASVLARKGRMS